MLDSSIHFGVYLFFILQKAEQEKLEKLARKVFKLYPFILYDFCTIFDELLESI